MDNSFTGGKICNILSKDGTAVLTLASGNSKLRTKPIPTIIFVNGNKDIWPRSFLACPMLRINPLCQDPWISAGKVQETKVSLLSTWASRLWFQMTALMVNRGLKSGMSPRAAPSLTLHAKLRQEESQAGSTPFRRHPRETAESPRRRPQGLCSAHFSLTERDIPVLLGFLYVACFCLGGFFCLSVFFFKWKHFPGKQEWFR